MKSTLLTLALLAGSFSAAASTCSDMQIYLKKGDFYPNGALGKSDTLVDVTYDFPQNNKSKYHVFLRAGHSSKNYMLSIMANPLKTGLGTKYPMEKITKVADSRTDLMVFTPSRDESGNIIYGSTWKNWTAAVGTITLVGKKGCSESVKAELFSY